MCVCCGVFVIHSYLLTDLMQGIPHSEAFSSLPPSLRGKGEGEEGEEEEGEEALWSLDREQVIAEMVQLCGVVSERGRLCSAAV